MPNLKAQGNSDFALGIFIVKIQPHIHLGLF